MNPNLAKPVTAKEIQAAANAMTQAVEQEALQAGAAAEERATQLAPGLAVGSNAPGGFNYERFVAPVIDPLTTGFVTQAQQNVLRNTLRDAQFAADKRMQDAEFAYRQRQRDYQAEQARRSRERRQAAERQAAADRLAYMGRGMAIGTGGTGGTGGGGSGVGGTNVSSSTYRQAVQAEANKGNRDARVAIEYAGDDGRYDGAVKSSAELDALRRFGVKGNYYVQGPPLNIGYSIYNPASRMLR